MLRVSSFWHGTMSVVNIAEVALTFNGDHWLLVLSTLFNMEVNIIPNEKMDEIITRLDDIQRRLSAWETTSPLEEKWLDVKETASFLKISTRTLQTYRDLGLLPYSQIAAKIYFRYTDVIDFLMQHRTEKAVIIPTDSEGGVV